MKILFTFLLGIGLAYSVIAQQTFDNTLQPAELVSKSKKAGLRFNKTTIFEHTTVNRASVNQELSEHKSLTLNVEQFQQLTAQTPGQLTFNIPSSADNNIELELVQVNLFDDNFAIIESATNLPVNLDNGIHYRGIIKGNPNSMASVSIYKDEVIGLISSAETGNLVLARLEQNNNLQDRNQEIYLLYNDKDVIKRLDAYCGTPDSSVDYTSEQLNYARSPEDNTIPCVRIYFEIDHDIYTDKGGTAGAANYITAIFNQCATLYANENVHLLISQIYVWNTPSPYTGDSSGQMLTQFQQHRTVFNGDLAQLVSYQASGGIAVLSGLCHSATAARMSFASVNSNFSTVPVYSFSVMVMTHEFGHLLGSHHTHACVWNGNNTAIDGCAGFTEGNCPKPGIPSNGGTIMSYCHITNAGVNFNLGFGQQPGNVIRSMVNNAPCLQPCSNGGGGGGGNSATCEDSKLFLEMTIDDFASENKWDLKNSDGIILYRSDDFPKASAGLVIRDTFCVIEGCYTFTMYDNYGDGICCAYGQGIYTLKDSEGNVLLEGGEFAHDEITNFCIPFSNGNGTANTLEINFADYSIDSHGGGQDATGTFELLENKTILKLTNNAWKSIALDYEVTPNTVIEFEFRSTKEGEVHGIGFDDDATISKNRTLKIYGSQSWGIEIPVKYTSNGDWQSFSIPVGTFYQGNFNRLFFVADHDSGHKDGDSFFRNVKIK